MFLIFEYETVYVRIMHLISLNLEVVERSLLRKYFVDLNFRRS